MADSNSVKEVVDKELGVKEVGIVDDEEEPSVRRYKKKNRTTHKLWVYPGRKMLPVNHYKHLFLAIQNVKDQMLARPPAEKVIMPSSGKRNRSDSSDEEEIEYASKKKKKKDKREKKEKSSKYSSTKKKKAPSGDAPKKRGGKKTLESEGYTEDMALEPSGKPSKKDYINSRLEELRGMTIYKALKKYQYYNPEKEKTINYTFADLRYDVDTGYLKDPRK